MPKLSDARWLQIGGALLCGLAALFIWRELAIGPEYLLSLIALAATVAGVTQRPRALPDAGMWTLCGCALMAGGWFAGGASLGLVDAASFHPVALPLLMALGLSLAGALATVLTTRTQSPRQIHALVAIGLAASAAIYYQLFTVGFAEQLVARRMVLTLVWLAAGLALIVRDRLRGGGRVLIIAAFAKALLYDTTHLHGVLRILLLVVTGGLLLGGSWALERRRETA